MDNRMPLNLQFFAEPAEPAEPTEPENADPKPADPEPPKIPTLKELLKDKDFASELDKHVGKAISTAKAKWDEDAKLTAEELAKKQREEAETALKDREQALARRELKADIAVEISKRGLPAELIETVNLHGGADAAKESLDALEKVWRKALADGIETKLKGNPPTVTTPPKNDSKLSDAERSAVWGGRPPEKK